MKTCGKPRKLRIILYVPDVPSTFSLHNCTHFENIVWILYPMKASYISAMVIVEGEKNHNRQMSSFCSLDMDNTIAVWHCLQWSWFVFRCRCFTV